MFPSRAKTHTIIVTSNTPDPRNTPSKFYNTLSQPLILSRGRWKVGVKKIIYLNAFRNIINESVSVRRQNFRSKLWVSLFVKKAPRDEMISSQSEFKIRKVVVNDQFWFTLSRHNPSDDDLFYDCHVYVNNDDTKPKLDWKEFEIEGYEDEEHKERKILLKRSKLPNWPLKYDERFVLPQDKSATEVCAAIFYLETDTFPIPPGKYDKIESLLSAIPKVLGIEYSIDEKRVKVTIGKDYAEYITLNNDLNLTLGFKSSIIVQGKAALAEYLPQLNRGRFAFFIYSNIVGNQPVGHMQVPLLDVISIPKSEFADIISLDVPDAIYREVVLKHISEIEINITTDSGELVAFDNIAGNAKTLLVLHFVQI